MCQIILRNYEDRSFSSEESQPDNDRVMDATKQEVKRLIKKVPRDLFDNDDDLPF